VTATSTIPVRTVNFAPTFTTPVIETLVTTVGEGFTYKMPDCVDPDGD
jgi:hypothetical protein